MSVVRGRAVINAHGLGFALLIFPSDHYFLCVCAVTIRDKNGRSGRLLVHRWPQNRYGIPSLPEDKLYRGHLVRLSETERLRDEVHQL